MKLLECEQIIYNLKQFIWILREYNLFQEIFKFGENMNILRYLAKSVFPHIFGKQTTHFCRIREESGSGRPPTIHLRTYDVTWTYYSSF